MPKYRIKLRLRGYVNVTVEGKDEDAATLLAEKQVNDNLGDNVDEFLDDVYTEVAECEEI